MIPEGAEINPEWIAPENIHDQEVTDADIGKAWRLDSSLKRWFPFTEGQLQELRERWDTVRKLSGAPSDATIKEVYDLISTQRAALEFAERTYAESR